MTGPDGEVTVVVDGGESSTGPGPYVTADQIVVCALPRLHRWWAEYAVVVQRDLDNDGRPSRQWTVYHTAGYFDAAGDVDVWRDPRDGQWWARHRHSLQVALELAKRACVGVTYHGRTAAQVLADEQARAERSRP